MNSYIFKLIQHADKLHHFIHDLDEHFYFCITPYMHS